MSSGGGVCKVPQWTSGRDEGYLHGDLTGDDGLLQVLMIFPSTLALYSVPTILFKTYVRHTVLFIAIQTVNTSILLLLCVACMKRVRVLLQKYTRL